MTSVWTAISMTASVQLMTLRDYQDAILIRSEQLPRQIPLVLVRLSPTPLILPSCVLLHEEVKVALRLTLTRSGVFCRGLPPRSPSPCFWRYRPMDQGCFCKLLFTKTFLTKVSNVLKIFVCCWHLILFKVHTHVMGVCRKSLCFCASAFRVTKIS